MLVASTELLAIRIVTPLRCTEAAAGAKVGLTGKDDGGRLRRAVDQTARVDRLVFATDQREALGRGSQVDGRPLTEADRAAVRELWAVRDRDSRVTWRSGCSPGLPEVEVLRENRRIGAERSLVGGHAR